jgi:hypothetical protein
MLKACLSNGFTTLRDVGGGLRRHRQAVNDWLIPGPRLFIGGPVLSQTGGHGKSDLSIDTGEADNKAIMVIAIACQVQVWSRTLIWESVETFTWHSSSMEVSQGARWRTRGSLYSRRMSKSDPQAHDVWSRSCQDLHFWGCTISNRQIDGKPIHCTGNQSRL